MSETMHCPRDGKPLTAKIYEAKIEVDECGACHGTWLDKGELEAIQATVERDYHEALGKPHDTVSEGAQPSRGPIKCPKCGTEMDARPYGMGSQILIDVCPEDCGIWLDEGELAALETFFERSQAETKIPLHWRLWASVVGFTRKRK
ncbi:MAG: zf-TFIIB domain-containing protein [Myxococcales bacterium]|nr:zf-TFIIB domain-containing protein [Myxococcales bacterium]